MAEFVSKVTLDITDFVEGMQEIATKSGSIPAALSKASQAAGEEVTKLKNELAKLDQAGQGGTAAAEKMRQQLATAKGEADKLAAAVTKVGDGLKGAGTGALDGLIGKFKEGQAAAGSGSGMFGGIASKLGELASPAGAAAAALAALTSGFAKTLDIGREFETNMQSLSAVTGLTGAPLEDLGNRARELAKQFGGEAKGQLEAFQGVLSKFGADLAKSPEQLGTVTTSINTLAKAGGLDAKTSMDTLANSMLQFGVNVADAGEAASESKRFINVLAASARVGAAEIPQVGQAVLVAGVAAKGAKVSFEETNAAIQVLAAGGKVGAEAGTGLRNVLGKLGEGRFLPKDAAEGLAAAGVDIGKLGDKTKPLSERLGELKKIMGDTALVSKLFGAENASAASILVNNADTVADWAKQMTNTDDATVQAAKNMNTFSERMSRMKAKVEDVFIGAFQKIGPVINGLLDNLGGIAAVMGPIIAAFAAYALVSNASAIATGAVTVATNIAKAAQLAYNAVMAANPIGLVVAAIGAAVVAYSAFSKSATETAEAQLKNAEAAQEVIKNQIEDNNEKQKAEIVTQKLVARYEELAKKTNLTKAEQKELKDTAIQLNGQYPELIDLTKSYQDNLNGVAEIGKRATDSLRGLVSQNTELNRQLAESQKVVAFSKRNVAVGELQESIKKLDFSVWEKASGITLDKMSAKAAAVFNEFSKGDLIQGLYSAKTTAELDAVQLKLIQFFNRNKDNIADSNIMLDIQNKIAAAIEAQRSALQVAGLAQKEVADAAKTKDAPPPPPAKAKDDSGKTAFELAKQSYELKVQSIQLDERQKQKLIEDVAIAQKRKLTEAEELGIKQLQLQAVKDTEAAARELLKITGEGAEIKTSLKLDAKEKTTAQKDVQNIILGLQDKATQIQFSMVPKGKDGDLQKKTEKELKDLLANLKGEVSVENILAGGNISKIQKDIAYVSALAKQAGEEGFKDISDEALKAVAELNVQLAQNTAKAAQARKQIEIDSMADGTKKDLAQRLFNLEKQYDAAIDNAKKIGIATTAIEADYQRQKEAIVKEELQNRLRLAIEALEDEGARTLAKRIVSLQKEREEILKSDEFTQQQREAIRRRYDKQIADLQNGTDADSEKVRKDLDKQEAALNKSLAQRKISYKEYQDQIAEIQSKRSALEQSNKDRQNAVKTVLSLDDKPLQDAVADIAKSTPKTMEELGAASAERMMQALKNGEDIASVFADAKDNSLQELAKLYKGMSDGNAEAFKAMKDDSLDSFAVLASGGVAAFLAISAASKKSADGIKGSFDFLSTTVSGKLDTVADKISATFDLSKGDTLDNLADVGKLFGASLASAELQGKSWKESTESSIKSLNKTLSSSLGKYTSEADANFEASAKKGELSFASLGDSARGTFLGLMVDGKSATDALKETTAKTVTQLLTVYVAPIVASALAFLGPFAAPVAYGAISFLQSKLKSALAGFKKGRHPEPGEDPDKEVGIVHGAEDVFNAQISAENRELFAFLHKGGKASQYLAGQKAAMPLPAQQSLVVDTSGLLRTVISRLESIEAKTNQPQLPEFRKIGLDVHHDDSLSIKARDRYTKVRRATR